MATSVKILSILAFCTVLSAELATSVNAAIISNGTIQLGINNEGHLNVPGGTPSSGVGTTAVGLRFVPTNADGTAPGCLCEGWGVADTITRLSGYANVYTNRGPVNLDLESFTSTASTASSVVTVDDTLRVTHNYVPSATPFLYNAQVTIENIGANSVGDLRYRRVMDWDIEPTAFSEFSTIETGNASAVRFTSDDGFASANPLAGPSQLLFTGEAVDSGPSDHGALFDFGFGALAAGATTNFNIFYGAASTEAAALTALGTVGAEVYSLGQADVVNGATTGAPNTFIFGFSGVGGEPVLPLPPDLTPVSPTPVPGPEISPVLSFLTLGAWGAMAQLKRRVRKQKFSESAFSNRG